jgi:hypothetical protein
MHDQTYTRDLQDQELAEALKRRGSLKNWFVSMIWDAAPTGECGHATPQRRQAVENRHCGCRGHPSSTAAGRFLVVLESSG